MPTEPNWMESSPADTLAPASICGSFAPFPDPMSSPTMPEMLRATCRRRGDAVAIEDGYGQLTYADLIVAADRLSDHIAQLEVGNSNIAILLPADARYGVTVFAALFAGRCCVLLDAGQPDERNRELIVQAGASLVVVAHEAQPILCPGTRVLRLSRSLDELPVTAAPAFKAGQLDDPAFIVPTSGSSGKPKLIVHSQRSILNRVRASHDAQLIVAGDRILSLSALSSLTGLTGLMYLLSGASIELVDMKQRGFGGLLDVLTNRPVTILRCAPSLLRALAQVPGIGQDLAGLRGVVTFGEPLTRADTAALTNMLPATCWLRTSYGATEAGGLSWRVDLSVHHDPIREVSGRLTAGTMAAVVDEAGQSCAAGETGELWIRSKFTAIGEWTDGSLQQGRLEAHQSGDGSRVYRTGDLARVNDDGVFVILGRMDRMIKINGQRVEPGEVEATLRCFDDVKLAEIIAVHRQDSTAMIAFVVPRGAPNPRLAALLRARLRDVFPSYMVPSRIICVDDIPLLPNGKVDTVALQTVASGQEVLDAGA